MFNNHDYNNRDDFNSNYTEAIKYPFTLAKNSLYEEKIINKYRGFNSYIEMEHFIKSISLMKQKVYFEVLTNDITKPFFDMDKLELTKELFNEYINEFIIAFNTYFNQTIILDDLLIYYRDDKENKNVITSSHIIIKSFNTTRHIIKYFLIFFNKLLDCKIYTKNRLYNLPYNTKLKYITNNYNNPKLFIDYKPQSNNVKECLVSYIQNTKKLTIPFYHLLATIIKTRIDNDDKKLLKKFFILLKNNTNKEVTEELNPTKYFFNTITDTIDFLIENLPLSFYTNSNDWKTITNILKKYNLQSSKVKLWNNQSSLKSNNKWDENANNAYYSSIDILKVKSGKPIFKKIVLDYLNVELNLDYDEDLIKWLETKTLQDCEFVKNMNYDTHIIIIQDDKNDNRFSYDTKSGFLKDKKNDIIGNYHTDITLKKVYEANKNKDEIILNHIDEIEPYLQEFNNKEKGIFSIRAKWGTGKTHKIIRSVIDDCKIKNKRVIMLSENNALNLKFSTDFHFDTHIKNKNINQEHNIACSTESIQRIQFKETDVLILDEYETLINHFESETFDNKALNKHHLFKKALKLVSKIVILDADLSNDRLELIEIICNKKIITFFINQNNFNEYKFLVYENKYTFFNNLNEVIKTNKKILIASSSKKVTDNLFIDLKNNIISKKITSKTILKLNSEGAFIFKNEQEEKLDKHAVLNQLEKTIINYQVDIFLFSPTIKTGISINTEYFNVCYGYAHNQSVCSREFLQMLFRSRNLIDKEIHIGMNTTFVPIRKYVNKNKLTDYLINPVIIFQSLTLFTDENEYKVINDAEKNKKLISSITDNDYLLMKIVNLYENYNSQTRFTQDLLMRLMYNHNINVTFISYVKNQKDNTEEELTEEKEEIEPNDDDPFVKARMITHEEYINDHYQEIIDQIKIIEEEIELLQFNNEEDEKNKTLNLIILQDNKKRIKYLKERKIHWRDKKKYEFFYKDYFIKGITDEKKYDTEIYNLINNFSFYTYYNREAIKDKYILLKDLFNQSYNDLQLNTSMFITTDTDNQLDKTEHKIGKSRIILDILKHIKLDIPKLPIKKTNKEYNTILQNLNFNNFQKELLNYYDNYHIEHNYEIDFNDKKNYIKNIKKAIHDLLNEIGVYVKYDDAKNTIRDTDKMTFYFKDFNNKPKYNGRLEADHYRTEKVKKIRKGFKTEDGRNLYKSNDKYYTTYEIKRNKQVNYLLNQKTDETIYKDLMEHILNVELNSYLINKNRPYVIDNNSYKLKTDLIKYY